MVPVVPVVPVLTGWFWLPVETGGGGGGGGVESLGFTPASGCGVGEAFAVGKIGCATLLPGVPAAGVGSDNLCSTEPEGGAGLSALAIAPSGAALGFEFAPAGSVSLPRYPNLLGLL